MASFAYCMFAVFCLYHSIYPTASDATLSLNVDNSALLYLSRDGSTYTQIATDINMGSWEVQYVITIPEIDITPSSIIKFEITDTSAPGGFIANINYNSLDYYTTEPIAASQFEVVSSSDGITSPLKYTINGGSPWFNASRSANMPADAHWIWNTDGNANTMIFQFKFDTIVTLSPTQNPSSNPSVSPSSNPSVSTSSNPSVSPSVGPTESPSLQPAAPPSTILHAYQPSESTLAPVAAPAALDDDTTASPQSEEDEDLKDDTSTVTGPDPLMIPTLCLIALFLCLLFICVYIFRKYQEMSAFETSKQMVAEENNPSEYRAKSQDIQNKQQSMAQAAANARAQMRANSNVNKMHRKDVCTDCGLIKVGRVYEKNGLFYCDQCLQVWLAIV